MEAARRRTSVALFVLMCAVPAGADMAVPPPPVPEALNASRLVYSYVPGVSAPRTWSEKQIDRVRFSAGDPPTGEFDPEAQYILSVLQNAPMESAMLPDAETILPAEDVLKRLGGPRLDSLMGEVGLAIEDIVPAHERNWLATAIVDLMSAAVKKAIDLALALRSIFRGELVRTSRGPEAEPEAAFDSGGNNFRPERLEPAFELEKDQHIVMRKRIARSSFKVLLGVSLGILLWGLIRNR